MHLHIYGERKKGHDRKDDCIVVHNMIKLQIIHCEKNFFEFTIVYIEYFKTVKLSTCFTLPVC